LIIFLSEHQARTETKANECTITFRQKNTKLITFKLSLSFDNQSSQMISNFGSRLNVLFAEEGDFSVVGEDFEAMSSQNAAAGHDEDEANENGGKQWKQGGWVNLDEENLHMTEPSILPTRQVEQQPQDCAKIRQIDCEFFFEASKFQFFFVLLKVFRLRLYGWCLKHGTQASQTRHSGRAFGKTLTSGLTNFLRGI
jgi:hypothetical protein